MKDETLKIPLNLAMERFTHIQGKTRASLSYLIDLDFDKNSSEYAEVKALAEALRDVGLFSDDRSESIVRAYNAFRMFQDLGSYEKLVAKRDYYDTLIGRVLNTCEKCIEDYFSDTYEKKWFACAMCGHESQLYVRKDGKDIDPDTRSVKEFKNISHICGGCWERYIHEN